MVASLRGELDNLVEYLGKQHQAVIQRRRQWEESVPTFELPKGRVRLDIGGQTFVTTVETLRSQPSLLSELFSGKFPLQKDQDGYYFFDRDNLVFGYLLSFLSGQEVTVLDPSERQMLIEEAEFFEVQGLLDQLEDNPQTSADRTMAKPIQLEEEEPFLTMSHPELDSLKQKEKEKITEANQRLEKEQTSYARILEKVKTFHAVDKIKLDVGGKIFCTTLRTLTSKSGFFTARFSGKFSLETGEDRTYFIGRDFRVFHLILRYLRTGSVLDYPSSKQEILLLHTESDFYGLTEVIEAYDFFLAT